MKTTRLEFPFPKLINTKMGNFRPEVFKWSTLKEENQLLFCFVNLEDF